MTHNGARPFCKAYTRSGEPCKNHVQSGSEYCRVHRPVAARAVAGRSEADVPDQTLREELVAELDALIERLQAIRPGSVSPPFSPKGLPDLVGESVDKFFPTGGPGIFKKLRSAAGKDLFDVDTWKGIWYLLNYTLEWGLDREFLDILLPFFQFMYLKYWRVETTGIENIPNEGRALLVVNHSGQLPWDGAMVGTAVLTEHPAQRLVRSLYATWFPTLPFVSAALVKLGQVLATQENGIRLLEQDELVAVYPEGYKGVGKLFKERYRLARFGRGGFIKMALHTGSPIIPVSVVGAEETYISLARSNLLARITGFPYFPISPTWPWLGPLGFIPLPTRWSIDFGAPIPMDGYGPEAANNPVLVSQLTDQVRNVVQEMIYRRLAARRSVLFG